MPADQDRGSVVQLKREWDAAETALRTPGSGAIGNLECRMSDLQDRLLSTPAASLGEIAAKLEVARAVVAGLGPRGYLLDLIDAILVDARALATAERRR